MAKRLFHSCRSPTAAAAVTPATTLLTSDHLPVVPAPAGAVCSPCRVPRRQPQPPAACGTEGCAVDCGADDLHPARGTPAYRWLKSSRWHVIEAANANTYATDGGEDTPRLKIDARRRVRRSRRRRRVLHRRAASWSSSDSGWFSSDDDEPYAYSRSGGGCGGAESSTLVTSTTTESSSTGASANSAIAAGEEVAMAGSFAVVKRSDDPRADFRQSMVDMVAARCIYDADGLERLLRCFLALNDRRHRRDIVAAFGDVWEAVFSNPPSHSHGPSSCKAAAVSHP
ncbi:transcription repressor OFP7-like [Phragmites australis]|uniref:transcription repressor OFP7-like n=1 Tax=Phragmites australis TaxID=29695 RepID=UPI002D7655B0|nr:transcription repressor OFP7-like [Phragmites australis]